MTNTLGVARKGHWTDAHSAGAPILDGIYPESPPTPQSAPGEQTVEPPSQWQPMPSVAPIAVQMVKLVLSPDEQAVAGGGGGLWGRGGGAAAAEQVDNVTSQVQPPPSATPMAMQVPEFEPVPSGHVVAAGTQEHGISTTRHEHVGG